MGYHFRVCLNLTLVCFAANFGIMLYLTLWLPCVLKVTAPWEVYCPNMIPAATALGVGAVVFSVIAFWPIWGLLTPLLVLVLLMGLLFSTHFIPWPF